MAHKKVLLQAQSHQLADIVELAPQRGHSTAKGEVRGDAGRRQKHHFLPPPNKRRKSQSPRSTRSTGTASTATPPSRGTRTQRRAKRQTNADLETAIRLVAQMAIRQEDHSNLTRSDRAFVLHMVNQTPGIIAPLLKVTKRWQKIREATPDQVRLPLRCLVMDCILMEMEARLAELQNTPAAMTAVRNQTPQCREPVDHGEVEPCTSKVGQGRATCFHGLRSDSGAPGQVEGRLPRAGHTSSMPCNPSHHGEHNQADHGVSHRGLTAGGQGGRALRLRQTALWTFGFVHHRSTALAGGHEADTRASACTHRRGRKHVAIAHCMLALTARDACPPGACSICCVGAPSL